MKPAMDTREQAETAAAAWIARRERDDWSSADEIELNAWVDADLNHRVAWLRLSAAWQQTSRLKTLTTSAPPGTVPSPADLRPPFFDLRGPNAMPLSAHARRRARKWPYALAASVLALLAAGTAWYLPLRGSSYHTAVGAFQSVPLSDGSRVTLNTNTALRVEVTPAERRVSLEQGEAYFEVAKDASRPFVVNAGDKRIIAVGTQFSVRRENDEVRVVVTEGKVRVEQSGGTGSARPVTQLSAGSVARAGGDSVLVRQTPLAEVEQILSWRSGYLAFDQTTLADAAAEFNRYNRRTIVIEDPTVAAIRVGGNFRATNVDAFVRLIESDFPIVATQDDEHIILTGLLPPKK